MPVSKSERRRALQERSRRAMKAVKATARTTTAPLNVWLPPPATNHTDDVEKIRPWCLLNKKQVIDRVGVSFPTIWKWMRAGKFPRARTVGDLKSVWLESEVEAWMSALPVRRLKDDSEA
jgi:predicted DNA-binding transcriptional regulator AlpA